MGAKNLKYKTTQEIASILTKVTYKEVAKTVTSFLTLSQNIYYYNDLFFDSYSI